MLRHCDQEERQHDGSTHWDSIKEVLMKGFAHKGARDFDDASWLRLIHDGSTQKRLEKSQDTDENCKLFPSYSGTLWWYSNQSRIDEIHTYPIRVE